MKPSASTCKAGMNAVENSAVNDAGLAEARPDLLSHMVTELLLLYQMFLDKSSEVGFLLNNAVCC
jgi:hypothetical protein